MADSQNIRASLRSIQSEYQQEFNIILISFYSTQVNFSWHYQIIACYGSFSEVSLGTGDKVTLISVVPLAGLLS